ncbi:hypothetical protein NliqN6_4936 [Naganishia liquefaciens]|uniref:Uncharacterized protein n=1 Tax=Naganishia liquefaciens TaxID=104408 RepID=A0A8H3TYI8_9TREE|nr:hypothetical protein NliqN6_4936 [Naganishia liquefaciens]
MIGKLALASLLPSLALSQYSATYYPDNLPAITEDGQYGTNQCGTGSSQDSKCQNAYINGVDDFCLFAPPENTSPYGDSSLGNTEREVVSWCLKSGYGTRLIPAGAVTGAHFVKTPTYVQLTGTLASGVMNIPVGDAGGELDPHGADSRGNPVGGLVFSNAFGGGLKQIHEWNSFIGDGYFCFKACDEVEGAALQCQHIYDVLGCGFNMPGDYGQSFSSCQGDSIEYPGVYGDYTFHQGDASTPAPHAPAATSQCSYLDNLPSGGAAIVTAAVSASSSASSGSPSSMASTGSRSGTSSGSSVASTSGASSSSASSMASSSGATSRASATSMASIVRSSASAASAAVSSGVSSAAASPSPTSAGQQNAVIGLTLALTSVFGIALTAF